MNLKYFDKLVSDCLKQYHGGECFFDNIDERIRIDKPLMKEMVNLIFQSNDFNGIIVSGKFGIVFKKMLERKCQKYHKDIICVKGGLRKTDSVVNSLKDYNIKNKRFIFVDDSCYLFRTRDKIKLELEKNGGSLIRSYIFYDGSKEKDEQVISYYRYYAHFDN